MNRRLVCCAACAVIIAASQAAVAQGVSGVSGLDDTIRGLIRASNVMLFDNTPLETHFRRGAWVINATPGYMRLYRAVDTRELFSTTTVRADAVSYGGWFGGISAYYATNESFLVFTSLSLLQSGGTLRIYRMLLTSALPCRLTMDFDTYNLITGGAFDFVGLIHPDSIVSLPIYFGFYMMHYDIRGDIAPYCPLNDRTPFIRVSGSGPAAGPYLGMAVSFRLFGFIFISLYGILNIEVSNERIQGTAVADNPLALTSSAGVRENISMVWSYYVSAGLRISLRGESHLSVSLVLTSFAPEMNPFYGSVHEGLRMSTYGLTVSYNAF